MRKGGSVPQAQSVLDDPRVFSEDGWWRNGFVLLGFLVRDVLAVLGVVLGGRLLLWLQALAQAGSSWLKDSWRQVARGLILGARWAPGILGSSGQKAGALRLCRGEVCVVRV